MLVFVVRRILFLLLTMLLVSAVVFFLTEAVPGDVARHILGRDAQPEQVVAFRQQLGLDQPVALRYVTWLVGNDWWLARRIGLPLRRTVDPTNKAVDWWVLDRDGGLKRWKMVDGELRVYQCLPDGKVERSPAGDVWQVDAEGNRYFWGVDTANRVVRWEGTPQARGTASVTGRAQLEQTGGSQYVPLLRGLVRGDPGMSTRTNRPVADTLFRRLKNSGILAGLAFIVVMPLAVLLGFIAGINEGRPTDRLLSLFGLVTTATPNFATGIFLILIFAIWLKWLPGATVFLSDRALFEDPQMLVLPVLTLTLIELGYVLRITRASVVEVMGTPYVRTAILKGLPRRQILLKHVARNAMMAPITVIMLHVNWLMGGIVVVEAIFGFPGLGTYLLDSAMVKDVYAIEAGAMVMVVLAVGSQLVADIVYTFLNPRIRYT